MVSLFETALAALADEDQVLNAKTLSLLSGPSRAEIASFLEMWHTLSENRKRTTISRMVELGEERFDLDFTAIFRTCLKDADAQVRRSAVDGLWEDEGWDLIPILIELLHHDPDVLVRAAAAISLGRYIYLAECDEVEPVRASRVRAALERVINDRQEDQEVVRRAVESIAYINDEHVINIIEQTYAQRNELARVSAIFAMGRNADPHWNDIVLAETENASAAIRYEAARACGEMQLKRAVSKLINLTQDSDAEVQQMAIWALGQIGGKQAEASLQQLAKSANEAISDAARDAMEALDFDSQALDMFVHTADADMDTVDLEPEFSDTTDDKDLGSDDDASGDDADYDEWDDEPLELD